jgi:hypothetical protein
VSTPVITGTGDPNDVVTLFDGNTVVGTGVVLSGGSWSITTSPLTRGIHSLTAMESDKSGNMSVSSTPPLVLSIVARAPSASTAKSDFNGDGYSDIFWQRTNGQAAIWEMNGTVVVGGGLAGNNSGPSWGPKSSGDFNADGYADVLWQSSDGQLRSGI